MARNKALARTTVAMDDGRSVVFGEGFRTVHTVIADDAGTPTGIRWDFRNGKSLSVMLAECPETNQLMVRGLKEKVDNEGARADVETVADMFEAASAMIDRLKAGTAFTRAAGGTVNRVDGITVEAFVRARFAVGRPVTQAEAIKILMDMGPDGRRMLTAIPEFAEALEAVILERRSETDIDAVRAKAGF